MGKKGRRQSDPGADKGEASDSSEDNKLVCPHTKKFKNKSPKTNKKSIYPVCKDCNDQKNKTVVEENASVESGEKSSDNAVDVDLLVCLFCASVGCGANGKGHAQAHQQIGHSDCHDFAFDIKKQAIWCFLCEKEVQGGPLITAMKVLQKKIETSESKAPETEVKSESKLNLNPNQPTPFLKKDLCSAKKKQPSVKGLMNLGNTCFFNSVLQCLAQTPYLISVLERLFFKGENCVIPGKGKLEELAVELNSIEDCKNKKMSLVVPLLEQLKKLTNVEGSNIERPESLLNCLKKRYPQFQGREQHDAHELLRHLLEGVRTDDHMRYREVILKKFDCYGNGKTKTLPDEETRILREYGFQANELPLGPDILFRGELISLLECSECKGHSHRYENFLDLSLPVTEEKPLPPTRKKDLDYSCGPSKNQLKKEKKAKKKTKKIAARHARQALLNGEDLPAETADAANSNEESDHSDADEEDNAETDTNLLENRNIESGYSSEKAQNGDSAESLSPAESGCAEGELSPSLEAEPDESLPPTTDLIQECTNKDAECLMPLPFSLDEVENSVPPSNMDVDVSGCSAIPLINEIPASPTPSPSPTSPAKESDEDVFDFPISCNLTSQDCERSDSTVNECDESPASDVPKCSPTEGGEGDCGSMSALDVSDLQKRLSSLQCGNISEIGSTHADKGESSKDIAKESNNVCPAYAKRLAPKISEPEGDCSVISCLNQFTAQELMTGSNKVGCDNCTKNKGKDGRTVYTNATKQLLISAPPAILVIQLKRFIADLSRLKKMNRHVSFPMSLDLASFCSEKCLELPSIKPDQKEIRYSLYGVVEHSGQMAGGHYVAYVKVRQALGDQDPRWKFLAPGRPFLEERPVSETVAETSAPSPVEDKWFYVSDSHVAAVDEETVKKSQAYLLFYERVV